MRPANSKNKKMKYNLTVELMGETKCDESFASLGDISKKLNIPYHTIADVYEGRRVSFNRFSDCHYFPKISISKLDSNNCECP
mgnify:CR=1 FL=1|tara:strand:+ start:172 stop:420 length:249 start_codon:yes stop_codon:yes gene_type:complete